MPHPAVVDAAPVGNRRVSTVRLRVVGGSINIDDHVPSCRADCPKKWNPSTGYRICGHVRCEWNLWMIDGRDRPGRRHPGRRLPSSEIRPVWLEWPLPPSCGADLLESGVLRGWTREQIAKALGLTVHSLDWASHQVLRKLRAAAADRKLAITDFVEDAEYLLKRLGYQSPGQVPDRSSR